MKRLNPDYVKALTGLANESPYFRHLGMVIAEFGMGEALVDIQSRGHHLQIYGNVHGGVIASLADTAIFWSCFAELDESAGITTVDLKVNYLAPVADGKLSARGRRIRLGRTLGLGEAEIFNGEGRLIAHGTSSVIVLPGFHFPGNPELPPKFL
ncbi:MAG: PaaI family thioesterase [Syntrophobacterales bacterium]|nr:PaaI family thioesterase [Syntrophobacterales bacterium]HNQ02506.1 PaaI family thioesterase [Syntrophales bacterium]